MLPKRKRAASSAKDDWRGGAKTTLLGPPPKEGRRGVRGMPPGPTEYRPPKPGLLGRPPPNPHFDEPGPRRLKPGLLDGPRRVPSVFDFPRSFFFKTLLFEACFDLFSSSCAVVIFHCHWFLGAPWSETAVLRRRLWSISDV